MSRERENTQVYISGFSSRADKYDIKDAFKKYGKIEEVQFKNRYAFVRYYDIRDADDAVKSMNRTYLTKYDTHKLTVEFAGGPRRERKSGARGPQQEDECWYCKKKGHWKNECKAYFSERGRFGGGGGPPRRRYSDSRSYSRDRDRDRRYRRRYSSSSSSSRSSSVSNRDRRRRRKRSRSSSRSSSSSSSSRSRSRSYSKSSRSSSRSSSSSSRSRSRSQQKEQQQQQQQQQQQSKSRSRSVNNN